MRDTDAAVVAALTEWRKHFEAGRVRFTQLFRRPSLGAGERFAVQILHVGYAPPGGRMESRSLITGASEGSAWATSDRLFLADGPRMKHEWPWSTIGSVTVLPQWNGVVFDIGGDAPAMLRDESTLTHTPRPQQNAVRWLKVEAAYAASTGQLDAWMDALPGRLAAIA